MSWATCYNGSNNIHFSFPPIMSDGRNYATWTPESDINNRLKQEQNIESNWDYRQYLQANAKEIMKANSMEACNTLGLNPKTMDPSKLVPKSPYVYSQAKEDLGMPFGYEHSDLKSSYLSREDLNARLIAPSIHTNQF